MKCFCPNCGKELVVLNIDDAENFEYTYYNYWCDDCNIEVRIGEPNVAHKFFVEIQDKDDFDEVMLQSRLFDNPIDAKKWYTAFDWINKNRLTASIMACDVDEDDEVTGDIEFWEEL